jgi:hypothetical protein
MSAYNSMKLAPFVALRPTRGILRLASAELSEILGGFGYDIGE